MSVLSILDRQKVPVRVIISDDGGVGNYECLRYACVHKYIWETHTSYQRVARINDGLRYVDDHVVLLDDDCIPESDGWSFGFTSEASLFGGVIRGLHVTEHGKYDIPPWFSTTNVYFPKGVLESVGGMDIAYNGHYGYEDIDLGNRLQKSGVQVDVSVNCLTAVRHVGNPRGADINHNKQVFIDRWGK